MNSIAKFTINSGQTSTDDPPTEPIDFLSLLEKIDLNKSDAFVVIGLKNKNYLQALRSPSGFVVECRYFFHLDPENEDCNDFIHYRAWNHQGHSHPGKAEFIANQYQPRIHERDHLSLYETASLLSQYSKTEDPIELPQVTHIHWRDITKEFPSSSNYSM